MEFSGFEMKVGYNAGRGLMKDHIFRGKAFRKVKDSSLGGVKVGDGFNPSRLAESVPSQDVIRCSLHVHPYGK
jgi:hypothetical protein